MAQRRNLIIDQGSTFTVSIAVANTVVANLSGYTANAQIRKEYNSSNVISFIATVNANTSSVSLLLTANTTATMNVDRYVYDCLLTSNTGTKTRLVDGYVTVAPSVTR